MIALATVSAVLLTHPTITPAFLLECFQLRCWARVHLVANSAMDLHEAIEGLQHSAFINLGLVERFRQDYIQAQISKAFDDSGLNLP